MATRTRGKGALAGREWADDLTGEEIEIEQIKRLKLNISVLDKQTIPDLATKYDEAVKAGPAVFKSDDQEEAYYVGLGVIASRVVEHMLILATMRTVLEALEKERAAGQEGGLLSDAAKQAHEKMRLKHVGAKRTGCGC